MNPRKPTALKLLSGNAGKRGLNAAEPQFDGVDMTAPAWLMGEGLARDQLVGDARALRRKVDPAALPILLPALSLGRPLGPLRRPLAYWWAARRGRY